MNALSTRKQLIIAQADVHRQFIELEGRRLLQHVGRAGDLAEQHRWWLVGGAALGSWLLPPRWRGLLGLLPMIPDLMKFFRR
jgi:hypothetical protein